MSSGDSYPGPEQSISTKWAGSTIEINNTDTILQEAANERTTLYYSNEFAPQSPIDQMHVTGVMIEVDGEAALSLASDIQLDSSNLLPAQILLERFLQHLAPQDETNRFYQKRPPFQILNPEEDKPFLLTDDETEVAFALLLDPGTGKIIITNDIKSDTEEESAGEFVMSPTPLCTIDAKAQLKSLAQATALVGDFANGLRSDDQPDYEKQGIPLKINYSYGPGEDYSPGKTSVSKYVGVVGLAGNNQDELRGSIEAMHRKNKLGNQTKGHAKEDVDNRIEQDTPEEDKISLDDIGGLEYVKSRFSDVVASFNFPDIMKQWGAKRPQGVLLYGEPGTGKTMLAKALANELGAELWSIQSSDIYDKWLGNSEKEIKKVFREALKATEPLVIFFDEFESIMGITEKASTGGADSARNAVAGLFKQEMNTLSEENQNVLVVAATNDKDKIDRSLIRSGRFDYQIYIPMPDQQARQEIITNTISEAILGRESETFQIYGNDLNVSTISENMDGFSGADITEVFRRLISSKAITHARLQQVPPPISQDDINDEIQRFRTHG